MSQSDPQTVERELQELRRRMAQLEEKLQTRPPHWEAREFYFTYHATTGLILGMIGASASLLFNVIGSVLVKQDPLQLIKVYLTFPLGEQALADNFDNSIALAVGCCLYLATGMLLGIPFQLIVARFMPEGSLSSRLLLATFLGLALWLVNFYGVLSWLQPMLFGGHWITDPAVLPPWVGAATHLVFAWTMAVVYPWGMYVPYRRQTDQLPSVVKGS